MYVYFKKIFLTRFKRDLNHIYRLKLKYGQVLFNVYFILDATVSIYCTWNLLQGYSPQDVNTFLCHQNLERGEWYINAYMDSQNLSLLLDMKMRFAIGRALKSSYKFYALTKSSSVLLVYLVLIVLNSYYLIPK